MKPCRLKIITACIQPEENEPDKEIIHYISKNIKIMPEDPNEEIIEEDNNIITENLKEDEEEEEEEIIIRDKSDTKKKKAKIKINKEKIYSIDGLFSSSNRNSLRKNILPTRNKSVNIIQSKSLEKDIQKLRSSNKTNVTNVSKNGKKPKYGYKFDHYYDNKINTFYNSLSKRVTGASCVATSSNKMESEKIFSAPENPFAFNFYKNNKEIDSNITGLYDYKKKIKELLDEETKRMEDRNNILKENKTKVDNLLKENTKLNFELCFEINREDELKGEIIILKNQYDILFNLLKNEEIKIKQYQEIIKHKFEHEKKISNKKDEIINYYKNLNECLTNGEILLVTKPDLFQKFNYLNIKNTENNNTLNSNNPNNNEKSIKEQNNNNENNDNINTSNVNNKVNLTEQLDVIREMEKNKETNNYLNYDIVTLLLKGYLINMNFKSAEEIVNKIWVKEKPLQTFETLTEELLLLIDNYLNNPYYTFFCEQNRNLFMNYFYSFCGCYNYMTKNEFISIFKDKLGCFMEFNENYFMSKLYKYCNGKLSDFLQVFKDLDKNNYGKIGIHEFIKALKDKNILIRNNNTFIGDVNQNDEQNLLEQNDIIEILELLMIEMKQREFLLQYTQLNKDNNTERIDRYLMNNKKLKVNIYELYYTLIVNIINGNSKSKTPLYKGIIKKYLIDKGINSLMDFLEPLFLNNDIIINQGLNRYIKSQTFVNFLISNNIIGEKETFLIPFSGESLIEINELVAEIDKSKPLLNNFEENKEKLINDIINDISEDKFDN